MLCGLSAGIHLREKERTQARFAKGSAGLNIHVRMHDFAPVPQPRQFASAALIDTPGQWSHCANAAIGFAFCALLERIDPGLCADARVTGSVDFHAVRAEKDGRRQPLDA